MKWEAFQQELKAAELSQAQFSDITGYSEQVISKWRHRVNGVPKWVATWFVLYRRGRGKITARA